MKNTLTIFFKIITVLIAISAFIFMLWEPHLEGRNINATLFQIYFNDLFLAYAYIASIAFFTILYQIFKLLGYIEQNKISSPETIKRLRNIRHCAISLIIFAIGAEMYFFIFIRGKDDIAGGVMIGLCIIIISILTSITTFIMENKLQKMKKYK